MARIARAIGALFLNFSGLEHTLSLAVAATLGLTEAQERPLIRGMMARAKLDLLSAYAKAHWTDEDCATLAAITKPARTLTEYRNDFAHGVIVHDNNAKWSIISYRGEHRFNGIEKPFTGLEILNRSEEIRQLALEFQKLADAARGYKPKAKPKRSGSPPPKIQL
jgi:hypothetical protein